MSGVEINFDGLVGPTHNYSGLSEGNLAATRNRGLVSRPRAAALQGLAKMRVLMGMGVAQGVLAPQERPNIPLLRALGFAGSDAAVWAAAWAQAPAIARAAASASSMWAANAATISPSADCGDRRLHASAANLLTMLHRAQEAPAATRMLRAILGDQTHFAVHEPLPAHAAFADEGAANHMRMAAAHDAPGVEIFVYGRDVEIGPGTRFPARQARAAGEALARRHGVARAVLARQSPRAIEAGAFHNDVVAVSHETTLFHHEHAFADTPALYAQIRAAAKGLFEPVFIAVPESAVPLDEAVSCYLFNAQLIRAPGEAKLTLLAPIETRDSNRAAPFVEEMIARAQSTIGAVRYIDVRESMRNGGGPACLRLRVAMNEAERAAATQGFFLTEALADALEAWVRAHYRTELAPADLADPALIVETREALDALSRLLPLGGAFYDFQRP
ncbi:MAG: N-succinylarginine dihydrolase [Hyphomonadaceae bacterium]